MKKTKIVIVQRIFSDYREFIFNRLSDIYDFKLIHSENKAGIKQKKAEYSIKLTSHQFWKFHIMNVWPSLKKTSPDVIIHEFTPSIISLYITYIYAYFFRKKTIVWGHGFNRNKRRSLQNIVSFYLRIFLLKSSNGILVYGQEGKKELSKYINPEKYLLRRTH